MKSQGVVNATKRTIIAARGRGTRITMPALELKLTFEFTEPEAKRVHAIYAELEKQLLDHKFKNGLGTIKRLEIQNKFMYFIISLGNMTTKTLDEIIIELEDKIEAKLKL